MTTEETAEKTAEDPFEEMAEEPSGGMAKEPSEEVVEEAAEVTNQPTNTGSTAQNPGRPVDPDDDSVVVGLPLFPQQAALSAIVFFLTLATLSALAGFLSVHNIAEYGPYDPTYTPELVLPDWYLMWMFGILKLLPDWMGVGPLSVEFVGGVLLTGTVILLVLVWPFIDRSAEPVHFTASPLERDWQTATGVAGIVFLSMLSLGGMNTVVSDVVGIPTSRLNSILLVLAIAAPIIAWLVVYTTLGGFQDEPPSASADVGGESDE